MLIVPFTLHFRSMESSVSFYFFTEKGRPFISYHLNTICYYYYQILYHIPTCDIEFQLETFGLFTVTFGRSGPGIAASMLRKGAFVLVCLVSVYGLMLPIQWVTISKYGRIEEHNAIQPSNNNNTQTNVNICISILERSNVILKREKRASEHLILGEMKGHITLQERRSPCCFQQHLVNQDTKRNVCQITKGGRMAVHFVMVVTKAGGVPASHFIKQWSNQSHLTFKHLIIKGLQEITWLITWYLIKDYHWPKSLLWVPGLAELA